VKPKIFKLLKLYYIIMGYPRARDSSLFQSAQTGYGCHPRLPGGSFHRSKAAGAVKLTHSPLFSVEFKKD
jgi:hypothetical protein